MIERIEIEVSQHAGGDGRPLKDSVDLLVCIRTSHGIIREKRVLWDAESQIRGWFDLTWDHLGQRLKREMLSQLDGASSVGIERLDTARNE